MSAPGDDYDLIHYRLVSDEQIHIVPHTWIILNMGKTKHICASSSSYLYVVASQTGHLSIVIQECKIQPPPAVTDPLSMYIHCTSDRGVQNQPIPL